MSWRPLGLPLKGRQGAGGSCHHACLLLLKPAEEWGWVSGESLWASPTGNWSAPVSP